VYAPVPHPLVPSVGFLFKPCYDSPGGPSPGLHPDTSPVSDTPGHGRAASLSPSPPFTPTVKMQDHCGCTVPVSRHSTGLEPGSRPAHPQPYGPPRALHCFAGNPRHLGCRPGPLEGLRGLLAPPRLKRLKPSPRCFGHIHNHLQNPARNTHSPVNARSRQWMGGRQWQGRFGIHQTYCLRY
jgi:hypothetical protein